MGVGPHQCWILQLFEHCLLADESFKDYVVLNVKEVLQVKPVGFSSFTMDSQGP